MEEAVPDKELTIRDFEKFITRAKKDKAYIDIDPDGNWNAIGSDGDVIRTLKVPRYRRTTKDEIAVMEQERLDAIREAETEYEQKIKQLLRINELYKKGDEYKENILAANQEAEDAADAIAAAKYKYREKYILEKVDVFRLLYDRPFDKHKMPHKVIGMIRQPFELQDYVRVGVEETASIDEDELGSINMEGGGGLNGAKQGILVFRQSASDDINGFLHPDFGVEVQYNGTLYWTIEQLIAAEKARIYGDETLRKKILATRSINDFIKMRDTLKGGPQEEIWNKQLPDILNKATFAKFEQNEDIRNKLLSTGNVSLAFGSRDKLLGVGIAYDKPHVLDKSQWVGKNLLGAAVTYARSKLRSMDDIVGKGKDEIKESVISAEKYDKRKEMARHFAIINNKRKMRA